MAESKQRYLKGYCFSFPPRAQPLIGVIWRMTHIGEWHDFDPADRSAYPKVNSPIQVRDAAGGRFKKILLSWFQMPDNS